jgi:hypothetical protein
MRNERPRHRDEIPREDWDGPEEFGHTWFEYAEEVRDFVEKHKLLPPHTTVSEGLKIGSWLDKQRRLGRARTGETLHPARRYYLETWVPEWELSPSEQLWNRQAEALAEFVVEHDRFPHSREVVAGYPLGRWLVFQRELDQKRGDDAMPVERGEWLDEHVPGWNIAGTRATWFEIAEAVSSWMARHDGRRPDRGVVVCGVNALQWLRLQKERPRTLDQRQWLDGNIAGWDDIRRRSKGALEPS